MAYVQYAPLSQFISALSEIPFVPLSGLIEASRESEFLQEIGIIGYSETSSGGLVTLQVEMGVLEEVSFPLPAFEGFLLMLGRGEGFSPITVAPFFGPQLSTD